MVKIVKFSFKNKKKVFEFKMNVSNAIEAAKLLEKTIGKPVTIISIKEADNEG